MKDWFTQHIHSKTKLLFVIYFILTGISLIKTLHSPIQDFGNYYYGSKLLLDGRFSEDIYKGVYFFNAQIANYGEKNFFENYIPVTPFSALFYTPFCIFKSIVAKNVFNLLSICCLAISLFRYVNHLKIKNNWFIVTLPLVFCIPIHNNIFQGQAYLIITSLVIETFLFSESGKNHKAAICLALSIGLKIFPAFFILYFLFKQNYRIVLLILFYFIALNILTVIFIDYSIVANYYTNILPRLMNNEIIGPYYFGNQSIYSAFLQIFSKDELFNPFPLFNAPLVVPIIESSIVSVIAVYIFYSAPKTNHYLLGLIAIGLCLINRYNPSYALVLLIPFFIALICELKINLQAFVLLFILLLSVSLPVGRLAAFPVIVQYARLILLLLLFVLVIDIFSIKFNWIFFLIIFIPLALFRVIVFPKKTIDYFSIQNSKGILYKAELQNDSLFLSSTLGEYQLVESFPTKGTLKKDSNLYIQKNQIVYYQQTITNSKDNKSDPFIYNDSCIVFMSDQNQAYAFYKLQKIKIP